MNTVVIMAGGKGERFWPKSRQKMPKQFLSLTTDNKTMLQHTVQRALNFTDISRIFIVTSSHYKAIVMSQIKDLPEENILCEPVSRNTAPCIAFAAQISKKKFGESVMVVLPSDHLIGDEEVFSNCINVAIKQAEKKEGLFTIGIIPSYPETGYGYINYDKTSSMSGCYNVIEFVEKPNIDKAKEYVSSGSYLWNSGMFVWSTSLILEKFSQLMPEVYNSSLSIAEAYGTDLYNSVLNSEFEKMLSESVDYGIMEKSSNIYTIPCQCGWNDVGSWLALESINKKDSNNNVVQGESINIDTNNCTIISDKRLIATIGLKDIIIVETDDAVLVCNKNNTQDVKKVISELKKQNNNKYL